MAPGKLRSRGRLGLDYSAISAGLPAFYVVVPYVGPGFTGKWCWCIVGIAGWVGVTIGA